MDLLNINEYDETIKNIRNIKQSMDKFETSKIKKAEHSTRILGNLTPKLKTNKQIRKEH